MRFWSSDDAKWTEHENAQVVQLGSLHRTHTHTQIYGEMENVQLVVQTNLTGNWLLLKLYLSNSKIIYKHTCPSENKQKTTEH